MCEKDDNPLFLTLGGAGTGIGFELELLHADGFDSIEKFCADYARYPLARGYLGAIKEDGSVRGAEFVTHPATLAEHRKRLPELLGMLKDSGFYAECAASGLHVHIGREVFAEIEEDAGIHRLLAYSVFGGAAWNTLQRRVMGRVGRQWTGTGLPGMDVPTGFAERLGLAETWVEDWHDEKFTRINLQHEDTLEFRQGTASTQVARVLGRIEFALGLCEYAVGAPWAQNTPEAEVADFLGFLEDKEYTAALNLAR